MVNTKQALSIVIPVCNEEETISNVIATSLLLNPKEIIVIANGCTDQTIKNIEKFGTQIKLIVIEHALGNDVGRAVGAKYATGDVVLFLDGDFVIPIEELVKFIQPIMLKQADVVLNDFTPLFNEKKCPHSITVWRQIVNTLIDKADIGIDSILSVPHALTKRAISSIGYETLAFPILAHIRLLLDPTLIIHHYYSVDVISRNRYRKEVHKNDSSTLSKSEKRMIGDHLYALAHFLDKPRGNFTDGGRNRGIVQKLANHLISPKISYGWNTSNQSQLYNGKSLSIIIPAQNEEKTIQFVIQQARKIEPQEIIVVVNGSSDNTANIARANGATTIEIKERLGNDVGRSIGARFAKGDIILFIDGDFVIPPNDLYPFAKAIANGVDISLNDLNHYLTLKLPLHIVTALKYGLNLALDSKKLGVGSMIAIPHGLSRKALNSIGWESLLSPAVAQTKALLNDQLNVQCVHRVEVDKLNKIRPEEHFSKNSYAPAVERIIGDHVEAIYYLLMTKGNRGIFQQDGRVLDIIYKEFL